MVHDPTIVGYQPPTSEGEGGPALGPGEAFGGLVSERIDLDGVSGFSRVIVDSPHMH